MGQAEPIHHSVTKIFKSGKAACTAENLQRGGLQAESVQWEDKQMDRKRHINRQIHKVGKRQTENRKQETWQPEHKTTIDVEKDKQM